MLPRSRQLLDAIRKDPDVRAALGDTFDFYLAEQDEPAHDWFRIDDDGSPRVIARKGSGCLYLLFGDDDRLAFVSSEGQAGVIAAGLEEGLELIVAFPYWEDLVGSDPETQSGLIPDLEDGILSDIEDLDEHRALVRTRLGLGDGDDALAKLDRAAATLGADFVVRPPDDPDYTFQKLV